MVPLINSTARGISVTLDTTFVAKFMFGSFLC